jgi:hypothetical protein
LLEPGDPESKGLIERRHRFLRTNFEPGRAFVSELDFQAKLDDWFERINLRPHRTLRQRPADRLLAERERMRPLPERMPDIDRRFVTRVPQQPYLRFDTNDSLDPRLVGRRVEVRISQRELVAIALDTGELAAHHRRLFAKHRTPTAPDHERLLRKLRGERQAPEVELRPLERYDPLRARQHDRHLEQAALRPGARSSGTKSAAAMIDRLVHHAEILALKGDSDRLRDKDLGTPSRGERRRVSFRFSSIERGDRA